MAEAITKADLESAQGGLSQLAKFGQAIQGAQAVVKVLSGHMQAVSELEIAKGKLGGEVKGLEDRLASLTASKAALDEEIRNTRDKAANEHLAKMRHNGEELANQKANAEGELSRMRTSTQTEKAKLESEVKVLKGEAGIWMERRDKAKADFDAFMKEHRVQ